MKPAMMKPVKVNPGHVLRYNFTERLVHWTAALSYIYLMLSGLAFWTPWMWWVAMMLGGGPVARAVHPWFGLIFTAAVIYMLRMWLPDMRITPTDLEWKKTIRAYVRNEEEEMHPLQAERGFARFAPVDRFNLGQKYLFWVMFWGGITLFVTGMVLWFTDYIPWSLRWVRWLAVFLHPVAFLVTLAGFIIHVYMGTAVVRGGFSSVIRGEVTEGWARYHHRLWYERVSKGTAPKEEAPIP
jgi:formate dehydrogenase subunit gamma